MVIELTCLFDALTTLNSTTEKSLLIALIITRQSYERHDMLYLVCILGSRDIADATIETNPVYTPKKLMDTSGIDISAKIWIEKPAKSSPSERLSKYGMDTAYDSEGEASA